MAGGKREHDWKVDDDGSLSTAKGGAYLKRGLKFPERFEMEVHITSTIVPDFTLSLGSDVRTPSVRLEMWGDSFVVRRGNDFSELESVGEKIRSMHFQILYDRIAGHLTVYSQTGQLLGQMKSEKLKMEITSLTLEAIDSDLSLRHLRISEWDGSVPRDLTQNEARIHLTDGGLRYGTVTAVDPDAGTLQFRPAASDETESGKSNAPDSGEVVSLKLTDIAQIILSTDAARSPVSGKTVVVWKNGSFLSGDLVTLDDDTIVLKTQITSAPVSSRLDGVRRLNFPNTREPGEEPDRLFFDGGSLRGNLTVTDSDEPIRWTPVGGKNATTLTSRGNARFQRGATPEEMAIDSTRFPDVIYLHDGDVFPARVETADKTSVLMSTPLLDIVQLDQRLVKAIEFGNSERQRHVGFLGAGWQGNVRHFDRNITFNGNERIEHESILTGDAVSFELHWRPESYMQVALGMFGEDSTMDDGCTIVSFLTMQNRISVTTQAPQAGAFWMINANPDDDSSVVARDYRARVEMIIRDGAVHVSINGHAVKSVPIVGPGSQSRRLVIATQHVALGGQAATRKDSNRPRGNLDINNFVVQNLAGASVKQFIQEETRERTLTIPRFRRDDPPTHVLLAPNGDVLRGRLKALTVKDVVFESRLEDFRFPRDRVAAAIWLAEQDATTDIDRPETAVQVQMDNGFTLTMTPQAMKEGQLTGVSPALGNCRIPAKAIRDLFLGGGSTSQQRPNLSYVNWIPRRAQEPEWEKKDSGSDGSDSTLVGQTMDDFELTTLNGDLFKLSDHIDKVVVLDFWATWCGPCVAALPEYVKATGEFDADKVMFVAVNLEESPERIRDFLERNNLNPTVAMDRGSVIARRFGVSGIPHSVVLAPGMIVRHATVGYQPGVGAKTADIIREILGMPPAEKPQP
ncbi:MAG: TlpA disulfide reductase family protein [Planctomycetaceae bacterium]